MEGLIKLHNTFHHVDWLNSLMRFFTSLGDLGFVWLLLAFIFIFAKKTRKISLILLISLGASYIFSSQIIKNIVNRPRPFMVNQDFKDYIISMGMELTKETSFPSSHTLTSFCSATVICYYSKKLGLISFVIAFLIAVSRIYLCVHYPTDVLAGIILGVLFGLVMIYLYNLMIRKIKQKKRESIRKNDF